MVTKTATTVAAHSKKRPNSDDVKTMLLEGNFGIQADDPLPITDPVSTTQLVLNLKDIKPYDKNPRRERNPAYEEIKASIRSKKQLNNNFNVTRRPGDEVFMVESGGNTRLSILNELYQETADEAFNAIHCLFVPWKSESTVLTAHLIENEMRGDMMLIDKAYAVHELKRELEAETQKKISDIAFTKLATEIGYKISPKQLRRFNYAIELDQLIPRVLRTGLGGHKIDHIKKVEKAYRQYCEGKTAQFDAAFMAVMSDSNAAESWDFDQTRLELDDQLAELTGVRYNLLRLEVDAILFNQPANAIELPDQNEWNAFETEHQTDSLSPASLQTQPAFEEANSDVVQDSHLDPTGIPETEIEAVAESTINKPETTEKPTTTELKILRQNGFEFASKIARSANIEDLVIPTQCGLGFFLESPGQPLAPYSHCYYCWWLLFGLSEQNVNNEAHYPMWAYTDLYSRFGEEQRNHDSSLLNWIGPDPGVTHLMYEILHKQTYINDLLFIELFRLMENSRKIRSNYLENEIWEVPA